MKQKKSFFEKLTGGISVDDDDILKDDHDNESNSKNEQRGLSWMQEENEEAELTVDVYQTPNEIIIKSIVAGVRPDDLTISITRDMVTIKGKREESIEAQEDDFFFKELYWGTFSRTIMLPQEVEPEEAEAIEKHGLLTIKLPKIDKEKQTRLKVKSI